MRASEVDAFLIGFPKSGTTSVAAWLDGSDAIRVSEPKETFAACPEFAANHRRAGQVSLAAAFGVRDASECGGGERRGGGEHEAGRRDASGRGGAVLLEATTLNVYSAHLLDELAASRTRVIVLLRDHARLVESWHEQMLFAGDTRVQTLRDAWAFSRANERDEGIDIKKRYSLMFQQGRWVARWIERLGHERVLLLHNEELRDAAALARRVSRFLGVDLSSLGPVQRNNLRLRRSARWLRHLKAPVLRRAFASVDRSGAVERFLKARIRSWFAKGSDDSFDTALREEMDEFFREDARRLACLVEDNRAVHVMADGELARGEMADVEMAGGEVAGREIADGEATR